MTFDPKFCFIPTVYCGSQERKYPYYENENVYIGQGTPEQCLRKGFGAAAARETKKSLSATSLRQIRYIGPKFEEAFKENGISDIPQLIQYATNHSAKQLETLFGKVFLNSNGTLNGKGFNSTLLYLYKNGKGRLPQCVKIQ